MQAVVPGGCLDTSKGCCLDTEDILSIYTMHFSGVCRLWFRVPPKVYFKGGCLETALGDLKDKKRAFIVTGEPP